MDQWNRTEYKNRSPHLCPTDFLQRCQGNSVKNEVFPTNQHHNNKHLFTEHILCPRQHGAPNEVVLLLSLSYQGRNGGSESVTCPRPHSLGARLGLRSSPPGGSQGPFGLHPSRDIKGRHNLPFTIPGRSPSCLSASACPATCPGPSPISALAELRCQLFLEPLPECPACCEQL